MLCHVHDCDCMYKTTATIPHDFTWRHSVSLFTTKRRDHIDFRFLTGRRSQSTHAHRSSWRSIPCASIFIVEEGCFNVSFQPGKSYDLKAGQGVFVLPNRRHRLGTVTDQSTIYWCHIQAHYYGCLSLWNYVDVSEFISKDQSPPLCKTIGKLGNLLKSEGDDNISTICETQIHAWRLLKHLTQSDVLKSIGATSIPENILRAIDSINREPNYAHSNESLASTAGLSPSRFAAVFKQSLKTTPRQYLRNIRILNAQNLLSNPSLTLDNIAERCGFSDAFHLSKTFKRINGTSPSDYRNLLLSITHNP